jgi:antitoxin VapB
MRKTAKVFMKNGNQVVRLPEEFKFDTSEVFIRKEGNDLILSPKPLDWTTYVTRGPVASQAFMESVEDLPVQ